MSENQAEATAPGKEEKTMAMLCHLTALSGLIVPIPLLNIIVPLVIWLTQKDKYPLVDDQGKESLNFQITMFLAALVCVVLMFVLIGFLLIFVVAIYAIVYVIIATMKANEGIKYRYPICLRLIK
ncbi:MAG: DUF4870 domain-containing protein [Victivallales bacterium]